MSDCASKVSSQLSPRWKAPTTVENFRTNTPNEILIEYAHAMRRDQNDALWAIDIGGGAARNAVPLAQMGFRVVCTDLSNPMLRAAQIKRQQEAPQELLVVVQTPMSPLPFRNGQFDLVVAHGIWNLARSGREFRMALAEAARVARSGAKLFVFTFSRHTIAASDEPIAGETFVFTQFNGEPCCFLSEDEIIGELGRVGWVRDSATPLTEYNRLPIPRTATHGPPVLFEGTFRRVD